MADPLSSPAESGRRYSKDSVELAGWLDVHAMALGVVGAGADVLDVGCADGSFARLLKLKGARVWGVDVDGDALANAGAHCERVERVDLDGDFRGPLRALVRDRREQRFSYIVALDVLEHLRHPEAVLNFLVEECLEPHGRVVVSLPNITHGAIRLSLLQGHFDYSEKGLLDRTHLRFFDRRGVDELLRSARLRTVLDYSYPAGYFATEVLLDEARVHEGTIHSLATDDDSFTYQFFRVAVPAELSDEGGFELASISLMRNELAVRTQLQEERRLVEAELEGSQQQVEQVRRELEQIQQEVTRAEEDLVAARSNNSSLKAELEALRSCTEYRVGNRLLSPLRRVKAWATHVKQSSQEHPR